MSERFPRQRYFDPDTENVRLCSYCGVERAVNRDHVIPKSYHKSHRALYASLPDDIKGTVPACFRCNLLKGTRRLVPPAWEAKLPALQEAFPGTPWRVWTGTTAESAYAEAWR